MNNEKDCHNCMHIELDVKESPCNGCGEDMEGWKQWVAESEQERNLNSTHHTEQITNKSLNVLSK